MSILRLSTLSLTLAIAVITLGYVNSSSAAPPEPCAPDDERKKCKPKPGDDPSGFTYTVDLAGAFVFNKVVTANSKETELRSQDDVTLVRAAGTDQALWDFVFEQCPDFFGPTMVNVPSFTAPSDGKAWTINKEGGVSVAFRKIPFNLPMIGNVEVNLYLNGTTPYEDAFLPVDPSPGTSETLTHILSRFAIWGQTAKGGTPGLKCGGDTRGGDLIPASTLVITATAAP